MFFFPERRKHRRLKVHLPVLVTVTGPRYMVQNLSETEFQGESFDISEGGAGFMTRIPLPENANICLQFIQSVVSYEEGQVGESIDFFGTIVYVKKLETGNYHIGIKFEETAQEIESKFFDVICIPDNQPAARILYPKFT